MAPSSGPGCSSFKGASSLLGALQGWHQWSPTPQIQVCVYVHQSVARKCVEYLAELARHNYVTPKSYLELLNIFSIFIGQKKQELKTAKNRMKSGLDKVGRGGALWSAASCPWFCPLLLSPEPAQPFNGQPTVFKWCLPPSPNEQKLLAKGKAKAGHPTDSQRTAPFFWGPVGNLGAAEAAGHSVSLMNEGGAAGSSSLPPPGSALSLVSCHT